ncbi:MAG TPA: hypothetical protein VMY16_06830 [Ilumatobacteraceae bacterium]|nr:hypothetical protein [Ilumatobacteraceae bacterium]
MARRWSWSQILDHTTTRMLDETYRHRDRPAAEAAIVALDDIASEPTA